MKLKNKKTGEIATLTLSSNGEELLLMKNNEMVVRNVKMSDLEEWKDYEESETFWYMTAWGDVKEYSQDQFAIKQKQEIGNYFETEEEAIKAVEKLKAIKRLKDKGFKLNPVIDDFFCLDMYWTGKEYDEAKEDLKIVFGGEE